MDDTCAGLTSLSLYVRNKRVGFVTSLHLWLLRPRLLYYCGLQHLVNIGTYYSHRRQKHTVAAVGSMPLNL